MIFRILFLLLAVTAMAQEDQSQQQDSVLAEPATPDTAEVSRVVPWKLATVGAFSTVSFAGSYFLVFQKGWWSEEGNSFHFANDFEYAKNLDKMGHAFGGMLMAEGFHDGYRWAGLSQFQSYLWAGVSVGLVETGIDVKDGYSPEWGFSWADVAAGTLGGFWPMMRYYIPFLAPFDFKLSYWRNSDAYFDQSNTDIATDDYVNQTFWLSLEVERVLPEPVKPFWPDWLAIAGGWGIDEGVFHKQKGSHEFYVGLDYDLESFGRGRTGALPRILHYLDYVKLPAPALKVYPHRAMYWLMPVEFHI